MVKNEIQKLQIVTVLKNIDGELFLRGKIVEMIHLKEAVEAFNEFLSKCNTSCLLVVHNAKFDVPRPLNVYGFYDSLVIIQKIFTDRKGIW